MPKGKIVYQSPEYIREIGVQFGIDSILNLYEIDLDIVDIDNLEIQELPIQVYLPKPHFRTCYELMSGPNSLAIHQYKGRMIGLKMLLEKLQRENK